MGRHGVRLRRVAGRRHRSHPNGMPPDRGAALDARHLPPASAICTTTASCIATSSRATSSPTKASSRSATTACRSSSRAAAAAGRPRASAPSTTWRRKSPTAATAARSTSTPSASSCYEMLTGRVPFEGESVGEVLMKHLTAEPDLLKLAPALRAVVGRALAKDPNVRFTSVADLARALPSALGVAPGASPHATVSFQPTNPGSPPVFTATAGARPVSPSVQDGEPLYLAACQVVRGVKAWWVHHQFQALAEGCFGAGRARRFWCVPSQFGFRHPLDFCWCTLSIRSGVRYC